MQKISPHRRWLGVALALNALLMIAVLTLTLWLVAAKLDKDRAQSDLTTTINRIVEQANPATVTIMNNLNASFSYVWPHEAYHRLGAGFVVSADGLILTNRQAVPNPDLDYTVVFADGKSYPAHDIYRDPIYDLVLLQIDATGLPVLPLAGDTPPLAGEPVIALGNRWQQDAAYVSTGRITAVNRQSTVLYDEPTTDANNQTTYTRVTRIYHGVLLADSEFNFGNAGGPLINAQGAVAGLIFTSDSAANQGFAIPAIDLRFVVDSFRQHGKIVQPDIGVTDYLLGARLEPGDQGFVYGAMISTFCSNAPAAAVGLKSHDRITAIDGVAIGLAMPLERSLRRYDPGDQVLVTYLTAAGEAKETVVTLFDRATATGQSDVSCIP